MCQFTRVAYLTVQLPGLGESPLTDDAVAAWDLIGGVGPPLFTEDGICCEDLGGLLGNCSPGREFGEDDTSPWGFCWASLLTSITPFLGSWSSDISGDRHLTRSTFLVQTPKSCCCYQRQRSTTTTTKVCGSDGTPPPLAQMFALLTNAVFDIGIGDRNNRVKVVVYSDYCYRIRNKSM